MIPKELFKPELCCTKQTGLWSFYEESYHFNQKASHYSLYIFNPFKTYWHIALMEQSLSFSTATCNSICSHPEHHRRMSKDTFSRLSAPAIPAHPHQTESLQGHQFQLVYSHTTNLQQEPSTDAKL